MLYFFSQDHWFPERPQKGQGYRCIRLNGFSCPDPLIYKAASQTGLDYGDLKLPVEFTLWVDPLEVSCRYTATFVLMTNLGANFVLYNFSCL